MLFRVVLALLASLCLACGGEAEIAAEAEVLVDVRVTASGMWELDGGAWLPAPPSPESTAAGFWAALRVRAMERRRPAYDGAPESVTFSACRLRVTIDPQARMESALALLDSSENYRWLDTTLACADPAVPTLNFASSTNIGIDHFPRRVLPGYLIARVAQGNGDVSWSLLEEPRDEQAVSLDEVDWERASAVVRSRRGHGGRLNLWVRVPPTMSWREFAPHLQRALELQPEWMEFGH
ncbi:MAG: hypothetical protein JNN27_00070 [Planctomycetes bacterium]|nr:hypothetical protein [Planctomycetota bacterium]